MNSTHLADMVRGWFIGGFEPAAFSTPACEVGVKIYRIGDAEAAHYHRVATEVTLVLLGEVRMCGKIWGPGEIIVVEPGEVTSFDALSDAVTIVVKVPGALDDKYLVQA